MRSAVAKARHFKKMIAHEMTEKMKSNNRTTLETAPNDPSRPLIPSWNIGLYPFLLAGALRDAALESSKCRENWQARQYRPGAQASLGDTGLSRFRVGAACRRSLLTVWQCETKNMAGPTGFEPATSRLT